MSDSVKSIASIVCNSGISGFLQDDTSEQAVPVAPKAADGTVWITAYNADGELPSVVEEALGVSGSELMDLSDAEEQARRF
ncbi:hypothetical protein SLV14_007026 [Streptomyces sp. Je 1-4]|uniref:hypothetical protein n=1 Tax=Streptomyces TaxID=1883 RepID=UPI0021DA896B|nr:MULTISPECIES: hypothetical protein [unclassified Streptomyces]UYB43979.1 hypothetical protein SLV14_007026 [Streptomyces sp. Je 1-4]UZQ40406.1 hypothetical protein SLV14N_007026 [Streptomyces sp. Je 1-4] [Streptomyces sp. Je 1-4 4N24]UZQ47823.1 hypothetical protein SLV14NA_007026 [Streptomyces sp. Je 1-4] [Streptomyces sp. Je 1-4 4N24_ara]